MLEDSVQETVRDAIESFGYQIVSGQLHDRVLRESVQLSENLASADIAVELIDSANRLDQYAMGCLRAAFIPRISLTCDLQYPFDPAVPLDYQPWILPRDDPDATRKALTTHFELYEQASVELDAPDEVTRYVDLLLRAANPIGEYSIGTRNLFIKELTVGDQYKVGQAGAVGPHSRAHDMSFQQIWNEAGSKFDLDALAEELSRLRSALRTAATTAEEDAAIGEVALAEVAAKQNDGPKALSHLKNSGKWALGVAEKIGVGLAIAAMKAAMGV